MQDFITLANHLADESGKIIAQYYRTPFDVEQKLDNTAVTIADKNVEEHLRKIIEQQRPEDGIIGEEFGIKKSKNQYDWVFDPIDGTTSFIMGRPTFGTLIALCENNIPILGIIDQPILKERWIGAKGYPTTFNGQNIKTRQCNEIDKAYAVATNPSMFKDRGITLEKACQRVAWGSDCYGYAQLANGRLDIVAESDLGTHDFAPMPPIIEGAGGLMCNWNGLPLDITNTGKSAVLALGDPSLKDQALEMLNSL